jgi:hypothetical protein
MSQPPELGTSPYRWTVLAMCMLTYLMTVFPGSPGHRWFR